MIVSNPQARQEEIVVQEVFGELVVYDLKRDRVHLLNPTAALVWQHCDGEHTPVDLAGLLERALEVPQADELLWLTLDRLEKAHLLARQSTRPDGQRVLTRRQVLKMAGVGIALLPVIKSIVAPTAAQAAATGAGSGEPCLTDQDCASKVCIDFVCL
jgi:hypothetical protein